MAIIKTVITNLDNIINNYNNIFNDSKEVSTLDHKYYLKIPIYQRPYLWSEKSVKRLFDDIFDSYQKKEEEYRLGTIILHQEKDNKEANNIVDGQQRLITLSLLIHNIEKRIGESNKTKLLFNDEINNLSIEAIKNNNEILKKIIGRKEKDDLKKYFDYLKYNCTFAVIVTDDETEAFQFFDSQNTRGKKLAPHDLLKAYHLREMDNIPENEKANIINEWEDIDDNKLRELFSEYLYPIINWYQGKDGLYYDEKKIDIFKGISEKSKYNYALYNLFSHKYMEKYKKDYEFLANLIEVNQFQLNQPVIAGKLFFKYVLHYYNLLKRIEDKLEDNGYNKNVMPENRNGDLYTKRLFKSALLFFVDRFNIESLGKEHIHIIYRWSYAFRLVMYSVYREGINKYAKWKHERLGSHKSIFKKINLMMNPDEIFEIRIMNDGEKGFNMITKKENENIRNVYNNGVEN